MEKRRNSAARRAARVETNRTAQTLLLAVAIVALAVISLILPDRTFSPSENRNLAQWPEATAEGVKDGSLAQDLDSYAADQFVLRDQWISLDYLRDRALGARERSGVFIGKDGYLIASPETPDEEKTKAQIDAIQAFATRNSGVKTYVMVVPGAASILTDKLPRSAPARDQLADIAAYYEKLGDGVQKLDVSEALLAHAEEPIYYKTDHHWTSLGAKYVFDGAAPQMEIAAAATEYESHPVSVTFEGTLASKVGSHRAKDQIDIYTPLVNTVHYYVNYPDEKVKSASMFVRESLEDKDQYTVFFGGNHALAEIRTTADTGRNLLLLKDSYANSYVQFLYPFYDNIIMIDPRYYYDSLEMLIGTEGITDTLILYSADTLFADASLADCLAS